MGLLAFNGTLLFFCLKHRNEKGATPLNEMAPLLMSQWWLQAHTTLPRDEVVLAK